MYVLLCRVASLGSIDFDLESPLKINWVKQQLCKIPRPRRNGETSKSKLSQPRTALKRMHVFAVAYYFSVVTAKKSVQCCQMSSHASPCSSRFNSVQIAMTARTLKQTNWNTMHLTTYQVFFYCTVHASSIESPKKRVPLLSIEKPESQSRRVGG